MSNEDELNDIFNDNSLTQEEKVERINNYFGKQIKQIEKDYNITLTKMCIGEILILLSCLIPVGAGAKVSTTAYKTFITSNFGRQIIAKILQTNIVKWTKTIALNFNENLVKLGTTKGGKIAINSDKTIENLFKTLLDGLRTQIKETKTKISSVKMVKKFSQKIQDYKNTNFLARKIGREIPVNIAGGGLMGSFSGALNETAYALLEDKNSISQVAKKSIIYALLGLPIGGLSTYAQRYLEGRLLKHYGDLYKLTPKANKQYKKDAIDFYKKYNQGILINKDESIIEMSGHAAGEQINKNPKLGQYFPELVKDIKNSKRMILAPNQKPDAKPHITHYEVYEGKYGWHNVEVYKDGHKRFHITKDTINEGLRPTRPGDKDSANLIITDALKKVHPNNKNTPLIKLQVEKNVYQNGEPTGFAAPLSSQQDVYNINSDKYTRANKLSHRKIPHRELEELVESVLKDIFDNFILRMGYEINNNN